MSGGVGLFGESGSGKTTLALAFLNLLSPAPFRRVLKAFFRLLFARALQGAAEASLVVRGLTGRPVESLPPIPLVSPNILGGAWKGAGDFRPALLDHYVLWSEELYWRPATGGARR